MNDKHTIQEYYKRKLYGGRGPFARGVDFLSLRAVILGAGYLFFASKTEDAWLRWFLSVTLLGLVCACAELYKSIRLDKFKLRERARIQQAYAREQLLLLPGREFAAAAQAYALSHKEDYPADCLIFPLQRSTPLQKDTVLSILRLARYRQCKDVALFSTAPIDEDAVELLENAQISIHPQGFSVLGAMAHARGLLLDDAGIDLRILELARRKKQARKKNVPFAPERVKRYLLVAMGLFTFSFFAPYALYYRLMAIVCISLGTLSWWMARSAPQQKL
ncbi:MAG: hypothetical protein Q4E65_00245 [Clostridia bacterium]|nr:hypothetical protein [Clostridia bacterium]